MEYQKIKNLLDNVPNQPTKFKARYCIEVMMIHAERITLIVKLNLKLQC